jgi:hypothetical protein
LGSLKDYGKAVVTPIASPPLASSSGPLLPCPKKNPYIHERGTVRAPVILRVWVSVGLTRRHSLKAHLSRAVGEKGVEP